MIAEQAVQAGRAQGGAPLNGDVMPSMIKPRAVLALMLAPLSAPAFIVLVSVILARGWPFHYELPLVIGISSIVGFIGLFAVGWPILLALRRFKLLSLLSLSLAGALAGILIFGLFQFIFAASLGSRGDYGLLPIAWGLGLGLVVALSFGLISGITNRSNSDVPKRHAV